MNSVQGERLLDMPLYELVQLSVLTKLSNRGTSFSLCSIMNVRSGACSEDCVFCAQSIKYRTGAPIYPYKPVEEVITQAQEAKRAGATRFSLVASGKGPTDKELDHVARCIEALRNKVGIGVCASLGILDTKGLRRLKDAGLTRYHHNLETSRSFFPQIVTTHGFDERVETIKNAQQVGLDVCSGGIIGLGEHWEHRLELANTLKELEVNSVPLNFLVPIPGTPMEKMVPPDAQEALRTICIFRIILPTVSLRLAGGRESVLRDFQGLCLWAGADAMLIGGYLTVRGREVEMDLELMSQVRRLWENDHKGGKDKTHG